MNSSYLSLLRLEKEITENNTASILPLVRQEVKNVLIVTKPFQKGLIFQSICRLTIKLKCSLIDKAFTETSFENQILIWVTNQVNNDTQLPLTANQWKRIKTLDSWIEIFFQGAAIAPQSSTLGNVIPLAIADFKNDFRYSFRLLKICWAGQMSINFKSLLDNCISASVQNVEERFEILDFLSDKPTCKEQFLKIARAAVLSETKNIVKFQQLLTILFDNNLWELAIACSHRIISGAEDKNDFVMLLDASSKLILAELQLNRPSQAAQAYQKYWLNNDVKSEFPYAGELIQSLHASTPHDKIIYHICSNIDREKQYNNLNQNIPFSLLIEAKKLEFENNWERARDYWGTLYEQFVQKDEKWLTAIACFLANNGLESKDESVVKFALGILQKSPIKEIEIYRRIILTLQICCNELSSMQTLQALRIEFGDNEDIEKAELLPDEEQVFSKYLVPRVLEALLVENQRKIFDESLNNKVTRRRLPKYELLYIKKLVKIDKLVHERRSTFKSNEVSTLVYDCQAALKLPLNNRQLLLLTERITGADNYIPKDQFGDYENTEIAHLMNVLLWLVAFRCEKLYKVSGNLSEMDKQRRDTNIKNMTIHTASSTLRQLIN